MSPSSRSRHRRSWPWRWRRLLLAVGLVVMVTGSGLVFVLSQVDLPPDALQPTSSFVFDAQGRRIAVLHAGEDRVNVTLDEVPRIVIEAVVAAEDRSFFTHQGLDPVGIVRATVADLRAGSAVQGGSTITQQYVKNAYLGSERTVWRKLREAALAVKLERKLSKEEILERYLNTIYWGRGAYGVQAAARAWFGSDVSELGLPEAAYLAGLIRAPESADVTRHPERAAERRSSVLAAMVEVGSISRDDAEAVEAVPLESYTAGRAPSGTTVVGTEWATEYVVDRVLALLAERYSSGTVYGNGLRVHTTIDLDLQRQAAESIAEVLDGPDDPDAALVSIDRAGRIVAMVGGRDHDVSQVNLALGTDGGGTGRQAGSAFKPFVLAEAVRQGWSVESSFESPPLAVFPKANDGEDWRVSNYGDVGHGRINLVEATRVSSNTVFAQLVTEVGPAEVVDLAQRMGITADLPTVASIALGTGTVSVQDMAAAYSTLSRRGIAIEPYLIERVETADGRVLFERRPDTARVLTENEADTVTYALRQVVASGTGRRAALDRPVAGKTGTTQSNGDAWFVGYTPDLTTAVWMGHASGQARSMVVDGVSVTGGSHPAMIFARYMRRAVARFDVSGFSEPRFVGEILGSRVPWVDPADRTTTTSTTSTTSPPSTTTTAVSAPSTTAVSTTTSTTSTTSPPSTTTTTAAP